VIDYQLVTDFPDSPDGITYSLVLYCKLFCIDFV